jgi:hypothetical protein
MAAKRQPVRFIKEWTRWNGDRYRSYATRDGRVADVRIRCGRKGAPECTNTEAKKSAEWRLNARPGSVRFVRTWKNDFTGLTWHRYESVTGAQTDIGITTDGFFGGRVKTRAETRAEAVRKLGSW